MSLRSRVVAVTCTVLLLPACGTSGLSFVQDERITISAPEDRARVELPLTVRWEVEDFEITGPTGRATDDAGYFGVLVDRAPPPPGRDLEWLLRDDVVCSANPECPDEAYLAARDIYSTAETSIVIDQVPEPARGERSREFHEVTVVLLDGTGRRIGESAFGVEFELPREDEDRS